MLLPGRDSWRTCRGPREGTSLRHVVVALLALALLGPISPSWADSTSGSSTPAQVGYGAGSFLGTLLYTPAKASFCLLGAIGSAPTALVSTLHTTCALFINEFQSALMEDLRGLIERLIPDSAGYCHDDPRISDCERGNARAHLRAVLLGRTLAVGVNDGDLTLGQFQSVIFAELDGPRKRAISIQVIGE